MEMVDVVSKRFSNPLKTWIRKKEEKAVYSEKKNKVITHWVFRWNHKIEYADCGKMYANFGEGGAILTTSQLAWYIRTHPKLGIGEYLVWAWQKGCHRNHEVLRLTCYDDYWQLYPKADAKSLNANARLKKDYKDEFKELAGLKRDLREAKAEGESVEGILEEIADLLEILESGKEYFDDEIIEEKSKVKRINSRGNVAVEKIVGANPWMRNIFPLYAKHCYHELHEHRIFPRMGRIVEKEGIIGSHVEEAENTEEMKEVLGRLSKERGSGGSGGDDKMRGLLGEMNEETASGNSENDDMGKLLGRM